MFDNYSSERIFTEVDYEDDTEIQDRKCNKIRCSGFSCTMEVLSMIKNTIIAEDANPITRYFEIGRHTGSCGPEMVWKIYDAVRMDDKRVICIYFICKICLNVRYKSPGYINF
ncbi:hypothetical protein KUTeg_016883 [Tegillarca granosa]|uniref:Uncharacterized protein n=1 Tax=Tegillarca granosa TaxID=220873 RepID=A0ABQ9EM75_TEGGR|nr:hypothetical protein KUTeg_016883 [Tegillarca granosa]